MPEPSRSSSRLRVYVDADVLLSGAASPAAHSASQVVLSLSEITLIDALTSELAVDECIRNLEAKVPEAVSTFELLIERALDIVPAPSEKSVRALAGQADWKDVPHLACAVRERCSYLATFNTSDYTPGHPDVEVLRPGPLVRRVRDRLAGL
jgi:predicted nucleic acid-binding protein